MGDTVPKFGTGLPKMLRGVVAWYYVDGDTGCCIQIFSGWDLPSRPFRNSVECFRRLLLCWLGLGIGISFSQLAVRGRGVEVP